MSPEVLVAIIAGVASVVVAVVTSYLTAQRTTANRLTAIEVKVDLLWKTYIVDAVKAGRDQGMIASHSKTAPTEKWEELMPPELRKEIYEGVAKYSQYTHDPYDISIQVTQSLEQELLQFSLVHHVKLKSIIGAIYIIAENFNDA